MVKEKLKELRGKKMVRKKFQVGQKVVLYISCWKGLLGRWKARTFGPFIVNGVFSSGTVEVIDTCDAHAFVVKGKKLRSYDKGEK